MHNKKTIAPTEPSFRQRAEEDVKEKGRSAHLSEVDVRALCHELEVHQIELEMQNEELRRVQAELAVSEEKYRDLYEFAPIGYLTLEGSGKILEANLAAASILGTERTYLVNNMFQAYLVDGSILEFKAFCRRVMDSDIKQTAELQLRCTGSGGNASAFVLIEGRAISDSINHGFRMAISNITERKLMEIALQESEEKFRLVADFTYDWEVWVGTKGNYVYVSPSCERITGHSAEEFMKNPLLALDIVHPDDKATFERHRNNHLSEKFGSGKVDFRIVTTNGETRWISHLCQPVFGKNGEWLGRRGDNRDITEQKLMEEELRESKANLEAVFSSMNDGVIIFGADGKVTSANSAAAKFHRFTDKNDFLMGLNVYAQTFETRNLDGTQIIPPHAWPVAKALRGEVVFNQEIVVTRRETGETWIGDYSAAPICDEKGKVVSAVVTMRDVTKRKRIEEELRRSKDELELRVQERTAELEEANKALYSSEQRLLLAQKAGGVGAYDWDIITGEFFCTPVLEKIYGMPAPTDNKVSYDVWLSCVPPEDRPGMQEKMQQIFESEGNELESEYRIIRPDGQERWIASHSLVIRDFDNRPLRIIGTNIDITERKKAEKELMKAKEAAEEAVKVKSGFMANMSHELRTPMNSVIGFTGLLLEEPLTVEQKEYVESIRNSGQALMMLINEVLDFSKMDREKMDLEIQTFDLRNITEEALDVVAAQATNKGLELNYTFSKNVPEAIIGDPGKLRQVLSNLLSNSVKFTKKGEIEVKVSSDPDQDEIHFAVRDTGIGIREEDIEKLFQPFSQLDLSYSRGFEGTGLGLAISKKLVELMGGRIWIESEVDKGSTFHFTIPAETAPAEHKPFLTGSFESKRVLIVEDNQTLRRILGSQLHAWSIMPMMASNIHEAMGLLQRDNYFDAVIIDASKEDAVSMIAEKRNLWNQLPFIALTDLGQKVPQDLFQAVLSKPLKPAKLFNALKDVLEKRDDSELAKVPEMEKSYGPLRILLAEDNISNQKVTLEMLKKLGCRADAVVNGQEVLEALERQPYDIIFMDVKMPLMNGIEATRKIRERWPDNGPKIIAITAYALHGDKEKCLEAGMDGYIAKPVQKEDLGEVLKRCALKSQ